MPLFKSAQVQTMSMPENKVILFEEELPHQEDDIVEVSHQPKEFEFNFPHIPVSGVIEVSEKNPENILPQKRREEKYDPWDWNSKGLHNFVHWIQDRLNNIPDMSHGFSASFIRAKSYLERLDREMSKAISTDYDGEIDVKTMETARKWIRESIEKLEDAEEKICGSEKSKKKSSIEEDGKIIKEARTPYTGGIIVTVPLLISRCARVCINGTVSAGHDLTKLFEEQVKKYSLNKREIAELAQHLEDMGYPLRTDRLMLPDEEIVVEEGRGDLASNYYA